MKEGGRGGGQIDPPEKTTPKKPSLIRVKRPLFGTLIHVKIYPKLK